MLANKGNSCSGLYVHTTYRACSSYNTVIRSIFPMGEVQMGQRGPVPNWGPGSPCLLLEPPLNKEE